MWELIRQNRRRSILLAAMMGVCLVVLGFLIGAAVDAQNGGPIGALAAAVIWGILSFLSYSAGDSILLSFTGAKPVTPEVHPQLFNVVEEMKIAAGLSAMPHIYILDAAAPNAFATGKRPEEASIVVTAGLLTKLNRDELQGVVAHEMSHILNRDTQFVTFAGVMLGTIVLISEIFLRGFYYSGAGSGRRYRSGGSLKRGGGQAQALLVIAALVFAVLAPVMARLLYFAISRRREYLADASAVRLTRYPEGLASALEKIARSTEDLPQANKASAPLFIVNPLKEAGEELNDLSATHPPISERIRILRAISQGAALRNYQEAFNRIGGRSIALIPPSGLKSKVDIPLRTASAEKSGAPVEVQKRELGDLMRAVNGYIFLVCACGMKLKLAPEYREPFITCPRCGRKNVIPRAEMSAVAAVATAAEATKAPESAAEEAPFIYQRKGGRWESFACPCGKIIQLSPQFEGSHVNCKSCGRKILIQELAPLLRRDVTLNSG
jgi:heat shock protein HtpX